MAEAGRSLWDQVRGRFWAQVSARFGLGVLLAFVLAAIYAPLLGGEIALLWWDDDGLRFPMVSAMFNQKYASTLYDLLFNLLFLLLPLLVLGWWASGRWWGWSTGRRLVVAVGVVVASAVFCLIPIIPAEQKVEAIWDDRPLAEETVSAYRQSGDRVSAWFPLIPHGPTTSYEPLVQPGSINAQTDRRFWLGTDDRGYDVVSRMIYGSRISLTIGFVAVAMAMFIGIVIGAVSGYFGGKIDIVLQRIVEIVMTLPTLILLLLVVAVIGRDIIYIMVTLGLLGWPATARLVRGEFLREMGRDYVTAATALGLPRWRVMFLHILPNTMTPLLVAATFGFAGMVLAESTIAFLGLGDPHAPSWGALLDVGRRNIGYAWLIWVPGIAIFALVSSLNLIGNAMREALDPKGTR